MVWRIILDRKSWFFLFCVYDFDYIGQLLYWVILAVVDITPKCPIVGYQWVWVDL